MTYWRDYSLDKLIVTKSSIFWKSKAIVFLCPGRWSGPAYLWPFLQTCPWSLTHCHIAILQVKVFIARPWELTVATLHWTLRVSSALYFSNYECILGGSVAWPSAWPLQSPWAWPLAKTVNQPTQYLFTDKLQNLS